MAFFIHFKRELKLLWRRPQDVLNPLFFFVVVISLFPLSIDPQGELLAKLGPGAIWIAALLSSVLAADHLFRSDFEQGILQGLLHQGRGCWSYVMSKLCVHWLGSGLILALTAPLWQSGLSLPASIQLQLFLTLLLGTPILTLLSGIGAALTLGLRQSSVLLTLISLPLQLPLLVFATLALQVEDTIQALGYLLLLTGLLVLALVLAPWAILGALKTRVQD